MAHRRTVSASASSLFPPPALKQVASEVAQRLKDRKETVSVAETAAGGLISAALIAEPGASAYFRGGTTVYTLDSRIAYCGWTQQNIESYRGPTPDICAGLAEHTRARLGSTYCISESGTAGPTGGETRNRTPGYVALAIATEKETYKKEHETGLETDRESNMLAFAVTALQFLKEVIDEKANL